MPPTEHTIVSITAVADLLARLQITHVLSIPDSVTGTWRSVIQEIPDVTLITPCREGEAIATAAGLWMGGQRPLVVIQCTGFYEAGDAFRNVVFDMRVPLKMIVGHRNAVTLRQKGETKDTATPFLDPILAAWNVPHSTVWNDSQFIEQGVALLGDEQDAGILVLPE